MPKKIDLSHVVKLDDSNYQRWKLQMTIVLKAAELWDIVSGTTPCPAVAADKPAWEKKDVEAQAILVPTLGKTQTNHVYNCTTSKEIFDRLKDVNSDSSSLNKQHTLTSFLNYKIAKSQSVISAYMEVEQLARSLNEMNVAIDDQTVMTKIVSSLPEEKFNAFKQAWDSVPEATQSMPMLLSRLRKAELERKHNEKPEKSESAKAMAFSSDVRSKGSGNRESIADQKKKTTCNSCGKKGHWARECRSKKPLNNRGPASSAPAQAKSQAYAAHTSNGSEKYAWISDSGATQHITGIKEWFVNYEAYETPRSVSLSDQNEAKALGVGNIRLEAFIEDKWTEITLINVLYIPGAVNLFSESVLAQKGFLVIRDKLKTVFLENGKIPGPVAVFRGNMYVMEFRPVKASAFSAKANTAKLWHERLSHINMRYVRNSVEKGATLGITLDELQGDFHCEECHLGKEARKPFPKSKVERKVTKPGEKLHADLSGKMSKSLGGSMYFLLLKDDCTGFRSVNFLQKKSEAAICIMDFIAFIQKQTGNKVKVLKTDNGSEFVNSELGPFLKKNGILHQTSAPYCPEANGRVEREMRTLKDTARAMLQRYEMPEYLWAEAIATSVYVHNRVLDKQSPEITAYERVFGKKPSLDHLRVFGCTAYAQVPKEKRKVWQPKAERLILIGYDSASQKYRLYDESSGKVIIARNVSFYEPDQCVPVRLVVDERHAEESDDESDDETDSDSGSENSEIKEEDGDSGNSEAETETVENAEGEVDSSAAHSGVEELDQGEDGQEIAIVPTPTPSSSRRASDTLEIHVTTADVNYVGKIPSQGRSNIVIPSPQKANAQPEEEGYGLRDRSKIKKTNRYHPIDNPNPSAHFAAEEI